MPSKAQANILLILDGWGVSPVVDPYDAITAAHPVHFNGLWQSCPHSLLNASGEAVGLPAGQMGNSEVGHLTIGSGRVVDQDLPRINKAIASGELKRRLARLLAYHRQHPEARCHLIGLTSDGGVHSHINHLLAITKIMKNVPMWVHAITDGRDTGCRSFLATLEQLRNLPIATISGRYYAMDRNQHWQRTAQSYGNIIGTDGSTFNNLKEYVLSCYGKDKRGDEFVEPAHHAAYSGIAPSDSIVFTNFRADRVHQLLEMFIKERPSHPYGQLWGMVHYGDQFAEQMHTIFPMERLHNTLGQVWSNHGKKQLRLAETEKYAHVTYFLDGGGEAELPGCSTLMIPSPRVETYDLCPQMSVVEVAEALCKAILSASYDFICVNFANADMVGHTGNLSATIKAIGALDIALAKVVDVARQCGANLLITADHGNAEQMYDYETSQVKTSHTINQVPLIYVGNRMVKLRDGGLRDIAPTILDLAGINKPREMTGSSLLVNLL